MLPRAGLIIYLTRGARGGSLFNFFLLCLLPRWVAVVIALGDENKAAFIRVQRSSCMQGKVGGEFYSFYGGNVLLALQR